MPSKVRVYGKAQNRTALGIVNAYLVMYPHATRADLEQAFPLALQDHGTWKSLFQSREEWKANVKNQDLWFAEEDEILHLQDGSELIFLKLWPKDKFDNIVNHAKLYDIEIASFEAGEKGVKGGYRLEYLNGYVPPVPEAPKKSKLWLWIAIAAAAVIAILVVCLLMMDKPQQQVVEIEKVEHVVDTVYFE